MVSEVLLDLKFVLLLSDNAPTHLKLEKRQNVNGQVKNLIVSSATIYKCFFTVCLQALVAKILHHHQMMKTVACAE